MTVVEKNTEKHKEIREKLRRWREESREHHEEFRRMHRHARLSPRFILLFNLIVWYLVFRYAGIWEVAVIFAVLFSVGGILEAFFLRKLECRIFSPIDRLKKGFEEIARGNYDVKVDSCGYNEISLLMRSFNDMADKLREGERLKAEYEENRKMLVANITHDLKTPITSIQGYIEAITEDDMLPRENVNKYLKIIHNNADYMNKLIDDLFLFSKLDMQKLEFRFATVDARPFFNDLMEEFKLQFEEEKVRFEYRDRLAEDHSINVDGRRLHQVFMNIMSNAVKYNKDREMEIRVKLTGAGGFLNIAVRDNGPGIPEDKLPHIFERFYRIDPERTKDLNSTGLGLSIAKELVEAHGGSIAVTSVEGEGTCFTLTLPTIERLQQNEVRE